ncbi:MAG: HTTM domain-containing protein [Planctomycetales bacterium]
MPSLATSSRVSGALNKFFFANEVPYGMALMRIILPWTLLINVFQRWRFAREIYSADGAPAQLADNFGYFNWLPELPGVLTVALFTALTVLLISSSIGWRTRFSLLASTILYTYFGLMDCMSTITKYTVIATHLLLLLGLSQCGAVWSVDAWVRRRNAAGIVDEASLRSAIWPQRLVQLLLGFMYFGAAITKMHTPAFFSGDQLMYWTMTYINNQHPLGDLLSQYPLVLSVFGYVAITWEIVFLFTVFQRWLKWWALGIGALFHIMTAFTLGLFIFPLVMLASYLAFLTQSEAQAIGEFRWLRRLADRLRGGLQRIEGALPVQRAGWRPKWLSAALFAVTLGGVCLAGVELEHQLDHYRLRGANGPQALRELPQEDVDRLLSGDAPLRQADKLQAFDLGGMIVGEHLIDRRRQFRQGEGIMVQATFSPPHEDLWLECILTEAREEVDPDGTTQVVPGKLMHRVGQIVPRENFRSNFIFRLAETSPPGEYFLKLRSGSEEIGRRRFTLLPKVQAPHAD